MSRFLKSRDSRRHELRASSGVDTTWAPIPSEDGDECECVGRGGAAIIGRSCEDRRFCTNDGRSLFLGEDGGGSAFELAFSEGYDIGRGRQEEVSW